MKMNLLRTALVPVAVVAVLVLAMSLAVPRAVHAVAATLVRDVDNAGRHPFSSSCSGNFDASSVARCSITIPDGEEVVLQTESIFVTAEPNFSNAFVILAATSAGSPASFSYSVPALPGFNSEMSYVGSLVVPADPGTNVECISALGAASAGGGVSCTFVGYYVTLP